MSAVRGWQGVQDEVRRRIHARVWKPGDLIPNEADLAYEFGCARATVNRALQALAEAGFLDRRRRAGTRVALRPVAKATLDIAILRSEIEGRGFSYGYGLLETEKAEPPIELRGVFGAGVHWHVKALHLADNAPYVVEDRWISLDVVSDPEIFETVSPNEWLLINAPYTRGEISFSAKSAGAFASALGVSTEASVFEIERRTWDGEQAITQVRLTFAPGYRIQTEL